MGLIMSRFGPRGPMPDFREGIFRLALHGLGVYAVDTASAAATARPSPPWTLPAAVADNAGKKSSENRGSRNALTFVLAPLVALVFSEKGRRRRRARAILKERFGMGELKVRAEQPPRHALSGFYFFCEKPPPRPPRTRLIRASRWAL